MRAYLLIPIPLNQSEQFVVFNEYFLKCPETGNHFRSKSDKFLVSNYEPSEYGGEVSSGKLREFNTLTQAEDFICENI